MPTITINDQVCEFEGKKTILQVALENGIEIPHYCYHEGLSIVASCRICLAEVWAPNPRKDNQLELIPRLMPACQSPAGDGQVVHTDSPKAVANQKAVMEYLLINHPLDCPVCDQAGECYLQDYSYRYGRGVSRFEEDKIKQPKKDLGENVWLYADRCIMCTRCVRFTREVTQTSELCVVGRGSSEQIDLFPGMALENPLSGNVVDICPVGALLDKDFLFQQRVWFLKNTPSIDGLTAGGDNIFIDHNDGHIYRMRPRKNMSVNKWWISDEIRHGWKFIHADERLSQPLRSQHGVQIPTSFANAFEYIDEQLTTITRNGGTVAALISPMLPCEEAYLIADYARCWQDDRSDAILGIGPIPTDGEDQTFPPGAKPDDPNAYTIRAEKAPNARGVKRILDGFANNASGGATSALEYDEFLKEVKKAKAVIVTGNYPSEWVTKDLVKAMSGKFLVLVDTLPNDLVAKADVVLPGATWAEKSGTFENVDNRLQAFEQAIDPIEGTMSEGQIFTDLITVAEGRDLRTSGRYNPGNIRSIIATGLDLEEFVTEVHMPAPDISTSQRESDMQLVEL